MSLVRKLDPRHWRAIKRAFDVIRRDYFTVSGVPPQFRLHVGADELRRVLGQEHFTNSWELSYRYEGEDLNMRLPVYQDDEYNWYQLHVRGFIQDDGTVDVHVHLELEPTEYPYKHINDINFSPEDGATMLADLLDANDIEYERID